MRLSFRFVEKIIQQFGGFLFRGWGGRRLFGRAATSPFSSICERMEIDIEDEEDRKIQKEKIKKHKYVGETARSAYERGAEHLDALEKLSEESHLLKHIASNHSEEDIDKIKFGFKVLFLV